MMRLRTSLFLLVLATAIPLAACALLISALLVEHQSENFVTVSKDRNRAFMTAVDTEINNSVTSLRAIASSRALARGDLETFHNDAVAALATQPNWLNLVLLTPDARYAMNALAPWGAPLPGNVVDSESLRHVVRTLGPAVGGVVDGDPFQKLPGIPVRVPVLRDGRLAYVLTAVVNPSSFESLILQQHLPRRWVTGLVDSRGRFIARVPRQPVGAMASASYLAQVRAANEGWYRGLTVDGMDTYTAFTVSGLSGWSVGFAIPSDQVIGGARRAGWFAAGGVLLILAVALGVAFGLSRRISGPLAQLSEAAASLGGGNAPVAPRSSIREVVDLGRALDDASAAILARDQELRRRASELQAADANKSQFLALLSHELRNPLAPLLNGLTLLRMNADPRAVAGAHAMMERQIVQLRRLIDDLLDVSRIDRGKLELRRERIAVDSIVRNAIETAKPNIEAKHHALSVLYAPEPLYVEGDAVRLGQVVANLINNAAKFTPAGGRIEVATRAEGPAAAISVKDSGPGFPPEEADRIFEMFVQLDDSSREATGGLGLGLTLVRSLVEMHGGRAEAESGGAGAGARFSVYLPLSAPPATGARPASERLPLPKKGRILVVDDNVDAADSLAAIFRLHGFEVLACYAGDRALAAAKELEPDVAFLDLNMPGLSGAEVAERLRAQLGRRVTLVALTGMGQKADIEATRAAGFDAHLTKPAAAEDLLRLAAGGAPDNVVLFEKGRRA